MPYKIFSEYLQDHKYYISLIKNSKNKLFSKFKIIEHRNIHKKSFGKTLIIGGTDEYLGAILISSISALRSGSRYVNVFTTKKNHSILSINQPELITSYDIDSLPNKIFDSKNILIGPGLSSNKWSEKIFLDTKKVLESSGSNKNIVIDAGFLNLLAVDPFRYENWILTPHVGEAARLLNTSKDNIQSNRLDSAKMIQEKYGGVVILKGYETIIQTKADSFVCSHGNSAMGTAGMGDCLAGIIISLISLVDLKDYNNAILYAVGIHSIAADNLSSKQGKIGLLASDVIMEVNKLLNNG